MSADVYNHDNWNGGIDYYDIEIPVEQFTKWNTEDNGIERMEKLLYDAFCNAMRGIESIEINNITIRSSSSAVDDINKTSNFCSD